MIRKLLNTLVCSLLVASPAYAASGALWAERKDSAPMLAQVPDFTALAEAVAPAVVSIQVDQKIKGQAPDMPQLPPGSPFEFFFRGFNGGGVPREFHNQGIGSGVVIREDGLVLTNYHVVENADDIQITFELPDGTKDVRAGKVLGSAAEYDVALVQTQEPVKVPFAYLGNSDTVKIGNWVMAIGTPFGLSHSVSVGIISAKERRDIAPSGRPGLYDFLQTDASINPGNSGGPLVSVRGDIIGINTAINAAGSGIGFAIPINMVKAMLPQLSRDGKFARSWMGIKVQPMTENLAQTYGLKSRNGALVAEVVPQGPAMTAGLKEGDIITEFDSKVLRQSTDLPLYTSMAGVGKSVKLKVWRDGAEKQLTVVLARFPDQNPQAELKNTPNSGEELGMAITGLTPRLRAQLNLNVERGALVTRVDPGSQAAYAGLRPGDVIIAVNAAPLDDAASLVHRIQQAPAKTVMRLKVLRDGGQIFVALRK